MYIATYLSTCTGAYRGLINSRNVTQKFESSASSKWFSNANLCGENDIWQDYTEFHKSVLSNEGKGRYLIYDCTHGTCGGYGNRISGIILCLQDYQLKI